MTSFANNRDQFTTDGDPTILVGPIEIAQELVLPEQPKLSALAQLMVRQLSRECNDLTPGLCQELIDISLTRYPEDGSWFPWELYNVERKDALSWPNCAGACKGLNGRLSSLGIETEVRVCYEMPFSSVPYFFRRGEDPFSPSHMLLQHTLPKDEGRIMIDPTYRQFLTWLCQKDRIEELKQAVPDQILVIHESEIPAMAGSLSKIARELSGDSWRMHWIDVESMERDFRDFWRPDNYQLS